MPGVPDEAYKAVIQGEQMVSKGRQASHAANRVQASPDSLCLLLVMTGCACIESRLQCRQANDLM